MHQLLTAPVLLGLHELAQPGVEGTKSHLSRLRCDAEDFDLRVIW